MPFIGQDWRSPGEVWIKTIEGWEPMKLLRKSHFVRQHNGHSANHKMLAYNGSNHSIGSKTIPQSSSSSSLSSSIDSNASSTSSQESDSENEFAIFSTKNPTESETILLSGENFIEKNEFTTLSSWPSFKKILDDESSISVADIIQNLQRSSSQPIPMKVLRESSEQIEIHHNQPYYRITLNPTKEVQGSNIISEAFYKLDFCNAIRDIRRFAYVSKLIHLLIQENLTSLSGNATKALFWMLEEIAKQVSSNKQNINVIKELLAKLKEIFDQYLCWGRPLGSTILWEQHFRRMERIIELTEAIEIIPVCIFHYSMMFPLERFLTVSNH
ncbi:hypothetical protein SSS_05594 [Sarcoptes scabiei]|nr:hypothetical protein SSS_05594 [Sarcoptes scabiei]